MGVRGCVLVCWCVGALCVDVGCTQFSDLRHVAHSVCRNSFLPFMPVVAAVVSMCWSAEKVQMCVCTHGALIKCPPLRP